MSPDMTYFAVAERSITSQPNATSSAAARPLTAVSRRVLGSPHCLNFFPSLSPVPDVNRARASSFHLDSSSCGNMFRVRGLHLLLQNDEAGAARFVLPKHVHGKQGKQTLLVPHVHSCCSHRQTDAIIGQRSLIQPWLVKSEKCRAIPV